MKQADGAFARFGFIAFCHRHELKTPFRHKDERGCLSRYHLASVTPGLNSKECLRSDAITGVPG